MHETQETSSAPADHPPRLRSRGFTLIELLVVIAAITILAAFLFPVFTRVREKAHQAACLSNMRQVTLGLIQYSADNDDFCPPYADATGQNFWPQFISPYVQRQTSSDFNTASKVFTCPSAPYDPVRVAALGKSYMSSYGLSDNWANAITPDDFPGDPDYKPHKFGDAVAPAQTVLLAETMDASDSMGTPGYALATPPIDGGDHGFIYANCDAAGKLPFSPARMLANLSWRHTAPKAAWCASPTNTDRIGVAYSDGHVRSATAEQLSHFSQWSLSQGMGSYGCRPDADGQTGCWYP